jgi:murein DD-endopeptidase MepM/ murein hydrolase activator NlpD
VKHAEAQLASARARREASTERLQRLRERSEEATRLAELAAGVHAATALGRDAIWPTLPSVVGSEGDLLAGLTGLAQIERLVDDPGESQAIADELAEEAELAAELLAVAERQVDADAVSQRESEVATARRAAGQADAALAAALGGSAGPPPLVGVIDRNWVHPLAGATITDPFGPRPNRPLPEVGTMHRGTDLAAGCGTPVRAAARGTVVEAGENGSYGRWVLVEHADGVSTGYAHLSTIAPRVGQAVDAGQVIGTVGSTGSSTGCHLHFEVRSHGTAEDAEPFMAKRGIRLG